MSTERDKRLTAQHQAKRDLLVDTLHEAQRLAGRAEQLLGTFDAGGEMSFGWMGSLRNDADALSGVVESGVRRARAYDNAGPAEAAKHDAGQRARIRNARRSTK